MRYHAIASPAFARRHFSKGLQADALASAPMIVFNRKDELQWRFLRRLTRARLQPPVHYLPSSTGFVDAAARGLGWCLAQPVHPIFEHGIAQGQAQRLAAAPHRRRQAARGTGAAGRDDRAPLTRHGLRRVGGNGAHVRLL